MANPGLSRGLIAKLNPAFDVLQGHSTIANRLKNIFKDKLPSPGLLEVGCFESKKKYAIHDLTVN
ncbi:hypothetical protein MARHY1889 [Marinobacter nauticus ATCC 49840]|nr:hypothetical protein MARHY1889 [Marinobacter nauticus ATCC 49840]